MGEQSYNPADAEFLLSRSLDEALDADEQQALDGALGRDAGLSALAGEFRRVDGLVKRVGVRRPEVDWRAFELLIRDRVAAGEPVDRLDEVLAQWGEREPGVDQRRFVEQVTARIAGESGGRSRVYRLFRVAVPLAAAAVIALAVLLVPRIGREDSSRSRVVSVVRIGPGAAVESTMVAASVGDSGKPARAVVAFGRTPVTDVGASRTRAVGITVVSAGMPVQDVWSSAPPL